MALPSSGSISLNQVNIELSLSGTALISLGGAAVRELAGVPTGAISFADLRGKSSVIVKTISQSMNNVILASLFTAEEWASSAKKQVIVASGVIVGSTDPTIPALRTGSTMGGSLLLTVNGSVHGASGLPNSGQGGDAIENAVALTIENNGFIRGGGGGGGKGGKGGKGGDGYYDTNSTLREPTSGDRYTRNSYSVSFDGSRTWFYWGSMLGALSGSQSSTTTGGWTYYRGSARASSNGNNEYGIYRTGPTTTRTDTVGGLGGDGGSGGAGQGSNANGAAGLAGDNGAAGGENSGAGGKGGTGGAGGNWGVAGSAGSVGSEGAAGNNGAGVAGTAGSQGGAAGRAITGSARTLINNGTINGVT